MSLLTEAAIVGLLVLAGIITGAYFGYDYASSKGEAKYQAHLAADRVGEENAQRAARMREYELAVAANGAAQSYEQGKADAQAQADRTAADLLAGNLRLQNRWAGCEADRTSEASAATRRLNAATADRAASAGRIVSAAAECDAQVSGLQALLIAERK
jgi:hypothetical protein